MGVQPERFGQGQHIIDIFCGNKDRSNPLLQRSYELIGNPSYRRDTAVLVDIAGHSYILAHRGIRQGRVGGYGVGDSPRVAGANNSTVFLVRKTEEVFLSEIAWNVRVIIDPSVG